MFRLKVIAYFVIVVSFILTACQPAATPSPSDEFSITEAPTQVEVRTDTQTPAATEPPLLPATEATSPVPTEVPSSLPVATVAPRNQTYSASAANCPLYDMVSSEWRDVLDQSPVPVLMYLWADDDESSIGIGSTVQEVANGYAGRIKVVRVNVNYYVEISRTYDIQTLPAFLLMNGQNAVGRIEGVTSKSEITEMLDQQFANDPSLMQNQSTACILEPLEITSSNWEDELITSPDPILVYYWSASDPNSAVFLPQLQVIAGEYAGRVKVGTDNMDASPEAGLYYGFGDQFPAVLLIQQGHELARLVGVTSKEEITAMLDQYLP